MNLSGSFGLKNSRRQSPRREFRLHRDRRIEQEDDQRPPKRFQFRRPRKRSPFRLARLLWLVALLIVVIFLIRYYGILNRSGAALLGP